MICTYSLEKEILCKRYYTMTLCKDVCNGVEILSDTFVSPFTDSHLVCKSNGLVVTEEVCEKLINARTHGENAITTFMNESLEEEATIDFLSH